MPIYGTTIDTDNKIVVNEQILINEGLFDDPPAEFITYVKMFVKRLETMYTLEPFGIVFKKSASEYVDKKHKMKYTFNVKVKMSNKVKVAAVDVVKTTATVGSFFLGGPLALIATSIAGGAHEVLSMNKLKDKIIDIICQLTGMKRNRKSTILVNNEKTNSAYAVAPSREYIFIAYPTLSGDAGTYNALSITLQCVKYDKWAKRLGLREDAVEVEVEIPGFDEARDEDGKVDLSSIFAGYDKFTDPDITDLTKDDEHRDYVPYPGLKTALYEYFDITDTGTRRQLMAMNEAEHNSALLALTSKLYDKVVSKAHNIDFGEIPKTNGDITKLSVIEDTKDTLGILKGIVKEYRQDTKPIDQISLAISNIQSRKDMFMRAFRANVEMPMLMYDNMVMAVIVGTNHLITACIEFIKAPKDESFTIQLDKIAYAKSKDHLIYNSIAKFNRICENGDFDKAMNAIIDKKVRKFTGIATGVGILLGIIVVTNIIPILRELVYLFYHTKVSISDYCEAQSNLIAMNAYNLERNDISSDADKAEIVKKQQGIADKFRKLANFFAIKDKKAEVEATKDIENNNRKYRLDSDANIVAVDNGGDGGSSALF